MIARLEQWLRWPLWSWRNLTISTIAVLVLFTAVGRLTTGSGSGPDSRTRNVAATAASTSPSATPPLSATSPASATPPTSAAPASATPTTSAPAAGSATGTNPIISPSSTPAPGADAPTPTRVALEFATAWTRTTSAQPAWLVGLKPLVTPEYMTALSTVDPARVPATRTLDAGRLLSTSGQQSLVRVATDAGGMTVTLVQRAGQWLVTDIEPAAPPPGATTPPLSRATGTAGTG